MRNFEEQAAVLWERLGQSATMVLATSLDGIVSARTMSVVLYNRRFYFQTDSTFRKYGHLVKNNRVALCADAIQVEGTCREMGAPMDFPRFCTLYQEAFPGSFRAYSHLENERLFEVIPVFAQRWAYENGRPFVERYDFQAGSYTKTACAAK